MVVEAIKLVEGGLGELCDEVWLVTCGPATQRARLAARGMDPREADRRIDSQGDAFRRLMPGVTRVIDTDGEPAAARRRVLGALEEATA